MKVVVLLAILSGARGDDDDSEMGIGLPGIYSGWSKDYWGLNSCYNSYHGDVATRDSCELDVDGFASDPAQFGKNPESWCKWAKPLTPESNGFKHLPTDDGKQCTTQFAAVGKNPRYGSHFGTVNDDGRFKGNGYGEGNNPRLNNLMELKVIDLEKYPKAKCLDGTPGTFYFKRGFYGAKTKWLVYLQGGGWCMSWEECVQRSNSFIGSSKGMPDRVRFSEEIFSSDETINPVLFQHNAIHVNYCDGASFGGTVGEARTPDGKTDLYFGGKFILEAVMDMAKEGLKMELAGQPESALTTTAFANETTDLIVSGCSAGGLAAYMHCDYFADAFEAVLTETARDKYKATCLPLDGVFLQQNADLENYPNPNDPNGRYDTAGYLYRHMKTTIGYKNGMEWSWKVQGLENGGGHEACIAAYKTKQNEFEGDTSYCYFAQNLMDHMKTRVFSIHNKFDSWATAFILGLQPDLESGQDPDPTGRINAYGQEVIDHTLNRLLNPWREGFNGVFVSAQYGHCSGRMTTKIDGFTAFEAFNDWYVDLARAKVVTDSKGTVSLKDEARWSMHNHGIWLQDYAFPCRTCGTLPTTALDANKASLMLLESSATATFDGAGGMAGTVYFTFTGDSIPFSTQVTVQLTGISGHTISGWAIHDFAANNSCANVGDIYDPYAMLAKSNSQDAYAAKCDSDEAWCQLGDLGGKFGPVQDKAYTSSNLPLSGMTSIVGRSVAIHKDGVPWVCAAIVKNTVGLAAKVDMLQAQLLAQQQTIQSLESGSGAGGGGVTSGSVVGIIILMDVLIVVLVGGAWYFINQRDAGGRGAVSRSFPEGKAGQQEFANPLAVEKEAYEL